MKRSGRTEKGSFWFCIPHLCFACITLHSIEKCVQQRWSYWGGCPFLSNRQLQSAFPLERARGLEIVWGEPGSHEADLSLRTTNRLQCACKRGKQVRQHRSQDR